MSRIFGEHSAPSVSPPKSYKSQIDGATVDGITGEGAAGAISSEGAIVGTTLSVVGINGIGADTGAFAGAGNGVANKQKETSSAVRFYSMD